MNEIRWKEWLNAQRCWCSHAKQMVPVMTAESMILATRGLIRESMSWCDPAGVWEGPFLMGRSDGRTLEVREASHE